MKKRKEERVECVCVCVSDCASWAVFVREWVRERFEFWIALVAWVVLTLHSSVYVSDFECVRVHVCGCLRLRKREREKKKKGKGVCECESVFWSKTLLCWVGGSIREKNNLIRNFSCINRFNKFRTWIQLKLKNKFFGPPLVWAALV